MRRRPAHAPAAAPSLPPLTLRDATIAVTGATGFLGRYLVDVLQARGARVVAVVRNPDKAPELSARGVELRRADLTEPEALEEGFRGADAVVSNAALFALSYRQPTEYLETNLLGSRNVIEAVTRAGVRRMVQVSTSVVYRPGGREFHSEDHPLRTAQDRKWPWNVYAISKAAAESETWRSADRHGIELSTVRPGGIYGAFDSNFTRVHEILMRWPISFYPVFFHNPVVYAADVADGVARILENDASAGRAYNLAGEPGTTSWDFLRAWRDAGGYCPKLTIPIPLPVRMRLSISRAKEELGWQNRPMTEGIRELLAVEAAGSAQRRIGVPSAN